MLQWGCDSVVLDACYDRGVIAVVAACYDGGVNSVYQTHATIGV